MSQTLKMKIFYIPHHSGSRKFSTVNRNKVFLRKIKYIFSLKLINNYLDILHMMDQRRSEK